MTKIVAASRPAVAEQLLAVSELRDWEAIVPVSAADRIQLDVLLSQLVRLLPESPPLYPDEVRTDESLVGKLRRLFQR